MQTINLGSFLLKYSSPEKYNVFYDVMAVLEKGTENIKNQYWLAGGVIRRLLRGDELDSDFDFFFDSEQTFNWFLKFIKTNDRIKVLKEYENENNVTLKVTILLEELGSENMRFFNTTLQFIKVAYYRSAEDVIDSFDYTICQFILLHKDDERVVICNDTSLWDLGRNRLVVNKITYPTASLRRMIKYTNQGFYACNGCLNDILKSVAEKPELLDNKYKYID